MSFWQLDVTIIFINPPIIICQKMKAERKFINEEKKRIVFSFQVFLTHRSFGAEDLMARFSLESYIMMR